MRHTAALALVVLPLAACGAGGGGGAPAGDSPAVATARGYPEVMAEAAGLQVARQGQRTIGREALPSSGYASYAGYLTLQSGALPSAVVGDITLSVDFADNDTVGFAGNFVGADGARYEGSVHGGGDLVMAPGRVTAVTPLAGTIRSGGDAYALDLLTRGDFLAPDGSIIAGSATTRDGVNGAGVTAALIVALD